MQNGWFYAVWIVFTQYRGVFNIGAMLACVQGIVAGTQRQTNENKQNPKSNPKASRLVVP